MSAVAAVANATCEFEAFMTGPDCETPFFEAFVGDPLWRAYRVTMALTFVGVVYYFIAYQFGGAVDRHSAREMERWRTLSPEIQRATPSLTPFSEGEAFQATTGGLIIFGSGCRMLWYCG